MKKFVLLHYGFEKPTPEIMAAWGKWFQSMKDRIIDMGGHFSGGRTALMMPRRSRRAIRTYLA